jgi:hypothetical protein
MVRRVKPSSSGGRKNCRQLKRSEEGVAYLGRLARIEVVLDEVAHLGAAEGAAA